MVSADSSGRWSVSGAGAARSALREHRESKHRSPYARAKDITVRATLLLADHQSGQCKLCITLPYLIGRTVPFAIGSVGLGCTTEQAARILRTANGPESDRSWSSTGEVGRPPRRQRRAFGSPPACLRDSRSTPDDVVYLEDLGLPRTIPSSATIGARRFPNAAICSGESQTDMTIVLSPDPKQISNSSPSARGRLPRSDDDNVVVLLSRQRRGSETDKRAQDEPPCCGAPTQPPASLVTILVQHPQSAVRLAIPIPSFAASGLKT